jgi:hypothetical protein
MGLINPYLNFYLAMPPACRRDPSQPVSGMESWSPQWLALKAAIAGHYAWAVPTDEAIFAIRKCTAHVVEIGAGSGYWAWMMRQAGIDVAAFDNGPPRLGWHKVASSDERMAACYPDHALLLCWPPWASDMADTALTCHSGRYVIYVGEWMGGSATPNFFARLIANYDAVDVVRIPQWMDRDDRLMVFRRR